MEGILPKDTCTMNFRREVILLLDDLCEESLLSFVLPHTKDLVLSFCNNDFKGVFESHFTKELFQSNSLEDCKQLENILVERVNSFLICDLNNEEIQERNLIVLLFGAAALQLFVYSNWAVTVPNVLPFDLIPLVAENSDYIHECLALNGMCINVNSRYPEYLWVAKTLLSHERLHSITVSWWKMRCLFVHQQILEERSAILYDDVKKEFIPMMELDGRLERAECAKLRILLHLEAAHIKLFYFDVKLARDYLERAQKLARLELDFTGLLGKRTKFQQKDVAQLVIKVTECEYLRTGQRDAEENILLDSLPKNQVLDDEVRLDKMALSDPSSYTLPYLNSLEQAVHIGLCLLTRRTSPPSELKHQEMIQYLLNVLAEPRCWPVQMMALYMRSSLEDSHRRTIERSLLQMQPLVDQYTETDVCPTLRLRHIYASCLPPYWTVHAELAVLLEKMVAVNSALDVYLKLQSWDSVIRCYQCLHRRDKAEAVIREQLAIKETPALWCYLGEATQDPEHFLRSWEQSGYRFARAQKLLGLMHFSKKKYAECIPHFEKCLQVNKLQLDVWSRLAFAFMETENFEAAASAYRHYATLDSENCEMWNNLGNVYLKLKDKTRAWRTFQESIRCNYEDWRIWENYMVVCIDCQAFREAVAAYHRMMDLKDKFVDVMVLEFLVRAVCDDAVDQDGIPASRLRPKVAELFGRVTSAVTNNGHVWKLYADLVSTNDDGQDTAVRYLQRAHRCFSQNQNWEKDIVSCKAMLDLTLRLVESCLHLCSTGPIEVVSSVKLSVSGTITKVKQYYSKMAVEPEPQEISCSMSKLDEKLYEITDVCNNLLKI